MVSRSIRQSALWSSLEKRMLFNLVSLWQTRNGNLELSKIFSFSKVSLAKLMAFLAVSNFSDFAD